MRVGDPSNCSRAALRRGMATLEFALALPVLFLLMVGIVWLGFFMIGQTEVTIEARNKAWKQRFNDKAKKPLMFPTALGDVENPLYSADADYVSEEATTTIDVSPAFAMAPSPRSSHMILAGSWDHRAMPLEAPPHWELVTYAVANAKTGQLQTAASLIGNVDQLLKDAVARALAEASAKVLSVNGVGGGGGGGIEDLASAPESRPDQSQRGNTEEDQRDARLRAEKQELEQELTQVNDEIEKLGPVKANEPASKLQERQLLELKKKRIENHLAFVNRELG